MFQHLILLALLAHNSLAFRLSHNKDDHHRWRRNEPSVATNEASEASGTDVFENDGCGCEKGSIEPFTKYAESGEETALVDFPEPTVKNCPYDMKKEVNPNVTPKTRFSLGRHVITYSFRYKIDDQPEKHFKCFVNFTVVHPHRWRVTKPSEATIEASEASGTDVIENDHSRWQRGNPAVAIIEPLMTGVQEERGCSCNNQYISPSTVYAKPGEQTALVNLPEPEVQNCPDIVRKEVNPKRLPARFSLGKHVVTYSFWYKVDDQLEPDNIKCLVNFTVAPCKCPTRIVNAKVKPGETEAVVSWSEPEPSCPFEPSPDNPSSPTQQLSVGKHTMTYKYTVRATQQGTLFDMTCDVNIIVKGKFCGKTTYDPATHVCCCGLVHEKNSGYECCGENYYNPREQICCADSILQPIDEQCPKMA